MSKLEGQLRFLPIADIDMPVLSLREDPSDEVEDLAASVEEYGILQPILVKSDGLRWRVVAGARRLQATRLAGHTSIPALEIDAEITADLEVAFIENVHRKDLTALEQARVIKLIGEQTGLGVCGLARRLAKPEAFVRDRLKLLELPEPVISHIETGALKPSLGLLLHAVSPATAILKANEQAILQKPYREFIQDVKRTRADEGNPARAVVLADRPSGTTRKDAIELLREVGRTLGDIAYKAQLGQPVGWLASKFQQKCIQFVDAAELD